MVSIVIVCMNNMNNIAPCLDSIKKFTKVEHKVWLVAYMFSDYNLQSIRKKYPWVKIIRSQEIRGFAENNNLALKLVSSKYTLILNDDTILTEPVVDELAVSLESTTDAVIMSPKLVNADGSYQTCGRRAFNWIDFIKKFTFGMDVETSKSKYINGKGIFQSYNISGACFMIRTEYFRRLGFFNEYYFFAPEDIALSTYINETGGKCYVNSDVRLVHLGGGSTKSAIKAATLPAELVGCIHFYGRKSLALRIFLRLWFFVTSLAKALIFTITDKEIARKAQLNIAKAMLGNMTPKQLFIKCYMQLDQ